MRLDQRARVRELVLCALHARDVVNPGGDLGLLLRGDHRRLEAVVKAVRDGFIYAVDWKFDAEAGEHYPVLLKTAILKESTRQITTERTGLAWRCRTQHFPGGVHRTPEAAWKAWIVQCEYSQICARHDLAEAEKRVERTAREHAKNLPAVVECR